MKPSWQRSQEASAVKPVGQRPRSRLTAPRGRGPQGTLLVVEHNVWLPDLLCRDTHELGPVVVGWVPLQLVVVPDLGGGGGEGPAWFYFSWHHPSWWPPTSTAHQSHLRDEDHTGSVPPAGASHEAALGWCWLPQAAATMINRLGPLGLSPVTFSARSRSLPYAPAVYIPKMAQICHEALITEC